MGSAHKKDYINLMHLFCLATGEEEPIDDDIIFDQDTIDRATIDISNLMFEQMGFLRPYKCSQECQDCEIYQFALWLQKMEGDPICTIGKTHPRLETM